MTRKIDIALKVDVDTLRGTQEGVPDLLRLFDDAGVRATFLFSLGPDHTGRALKRIFRPGFLRKVRRTSVASHYGLRTLLYGTLLPGPDIGRRSKAILRSVTEAGHEVGIHCYDHVKWQDYVAHKDSTWTRREMTLARQAFTAVFGQEARVHGAAGWQMNTAAFQLEAELGFDYASDCRGQHPFMPVVEGQEIACPQLPTTLPTLDELIGENDITEDNVHEAILAATAEMPAQGHVYTLHAELEGMKLLPVMQRLLENWRGQGISVGSLAEQFAGLELAALPRHEVVQGSVAGRSGLLTVQGRALTATGTERAG